MAMHFLFVPFRRPPILPWFLLLGLCRQGWAEGFPSPDPLPPALAARTGEACDSLGAVRDRILQSLIEGAPVDVEQERERLRKQFPGIDLGLVTTPEEVVVRLLSHDWSGLSDPRFELSARELGRRNVGRVMPRADVFFRSLASLTLERRNELRAGILAGLAGRERERALLLLDAVILDGPELAALRPRRDSLARQGVVMPAFVDAWIGQAAPKGQNAVSFLVGVGGYAGASAVDRTFESGPAMTIQFGWMRRDFWAELCVLPTWGDLRRPVAWRGHTWNPGDDLDRVAFEVRGALTPGFLGDHVSIGPMIGWGFTEFRDSSVARRDGTGKEDRSIMAYPYHVAAGLSLQYRSAPQGPFHGLVRLQGGRRFTLDDPSTPFTDRRWFFEVQMGLAAAGVTTSGLHP